MDPRPAAAAAAAAAESESCSLLGVERLPMPSTSVRPWRLQPGGMSGACRVQELDVLGGGVTLVFSLDGLNWLCRRRRGGEGKEKRGEELQLWIPSGQTMAAGEKLQPATCFRIHDRRGSALRDLCRDTDCRPSSATRPSSRCLSAQHRRPLGNSSVSSEFPEEAPWTRLIVNTRDVFTLITRNVNVTAQQDTLTMDRPNRSITFCNEGRPPRPFGEIRSARSDRRTFEENAAYHVSGNNNVSRCLQSGHPLADLNNNSEEDRGEAAPRENFNTRTSRKGLLKNRCRNCNRPGGSPGRDWDGNTRRSVSFNDDVIVYLFDQECPTAQLRSEAFAPLPSGSACNLPDVTLEDSGLEWEDDFSALERSSRLQRVGPSPPTRSWADACGPQRYLPSQTCLFLTHVTESDLEL